MSPDPYTALMGTLTLMLWVFVAASEKTFRAAMLNMVDSITALGSHDRRGGSNMRRFILTVLAPVGDMMATAYTILMINGFAWAIATIRILPGNPMVKDLAFIYGIMAIIGFPLFIGYVILLLAAALIYRVPLKPIFIDPDQRAGLLQEGQA